MFETKRCGRGFRLALTIVLAMASPLIGVLSAGAQSGPPLRVILLPTLIPQTIRQMLPITVDAPGAGADLEPQKISLVSMVYCGGDGEGHGNAVGVVIPGEVQRHIAQELPAEACGASLQAIAARQMSIGGTPEWVEAVKLRAGWTPWRLMLSVTDAAGVAKPGFSAPNLRKLGPIASYQTSGLRLLSGAGSNVPFDLAVGFPERAIVLVAAPSGQLSNPGTYLSGTAVTREIATAPQASNVVAEATYTFINQVMRLYGSTFQIPIPIQGATEMMTARNLVAGGGENTMRVAGVLDYNGIAYNATVDCAGEDLTVRQIMLDAPAPNCDQDDMVARLQCQGRGLAMAGSSQALTSALTGYYREQPLHVSTQARPITFAVGDAEYLATFEALKSSSHGGSFIEAGRAEVRRAAGRP